MPYLVCAQGLNSTGACHEAPQGSQTPDPEGPNTIKLWNNTEYSPLHSAIWLNMPEL